MAHKERSGEWNRLAAVEKACLINRSFPYTEPIQKWKEEGKKVIGYTCTYVPEEIIHAAGMLPVRVTGGGKQIALTDADMQLNPKLCSYSRTCYQLVYQGDYSFLDGLIVGSTCDAMRRLFDAWKYYGTMPFTYIIDVPLILNQEYALQRYMKLLKEMVQELSDRFGAEITDKSLFESIAAVNRKRVLLQKLYSWRKRKPAAITGAETMEILNAGFRIPLDQYEALLQQVLAELQKTERSVEGEIRLMVSGGPIDRVDFIKDIEEAGAVVVVDESCMGIRHWSGLVEEDTGLQPLEAIARRYYSNLPCPRFSPHNVRIESVLSLANEYEVDGVIQNVLHNCSCLTWDGALLARHLKAREIPLLSLDTEYAAGLEGMLQTKVQAFLEIFETRQENAIS